MRKLAILIGNNDGLPGVKKDLQNVYGYLRSPKGGFWDDEEIKIIHDPRLNLLEYLQRAKKVNFDYLFFYFSGHGRQQRGVEISLNKDGECIKESDITHLCQKQLTIFDCCRGNDKSVGLSDSRLYGIRYPKYYAFAKQKYENKILHALNQQVILYSCSKGEYSSDTGEGGLYTKNLINSAKISKEEYISVIDVHLNAYNLTIVENQKQNPDYIMDKIPPNRQLIFGVNQEKNVGKQLRPGFK